MPLEATAGFKESSLTGAKYVKIRVCTDESIPFKATLTVTRSNPSMGGDRQRSAEDDTVVAMTPSLPKKHLDGVVDCRSCPTIVTTEFPCAGPIEGERLSKKGNSM